MASSRKGPGKPDAETMQDEPTQPRPRDAAGRQLDGHGLPLNGPARARALEERGVEDPALAEAAAEGAPANPATQEG